MVFHSIMHIAFFTKQFDEMMDFYINKMGLELKVLVRYGSYLNRDDCPEMQKIAQKDPKRIFNAYIQIAPGQFIELFPSREDQKPHDEWNECAGYTHFALVVDDIKKTYQEFLDTGIIPDTELAKGPSGTWKFWAHDPDNNHFEVMQYTKDSYQLVGYVDE